jgi:hypothetical protein
VPDPEIGRLDLGLDLRHLQLEALALALAGEERVEVAFDQADLGLLLSAQGIDPHALDHGLRIGVQAQPALVAEGDLGGRARERPDLLVLDQDRVQLTVGPHQVLRPLALDPALAVAEQRVGGGIPLLERGPQRRIGRDLGVARELDHGIPVAGLALGERRIVQLDRLGDLLGREQAGALLGRLLNQIQNT